MTRYCFLLLLVFLSACTQGGDPVPARIKNALVGYWYQLDGPGVMHFYEDNTVKIELPERHPPVRIISNYELLKGDRIGINTGEIWNGPLICTLAASQKELVLDIPDPEQRSLRFRKGKRG